MTAGGACYFHEPTIKVLKQMLPEMQLRRLMTQVHSLPPLYMFVVKCTPTEEQVRLMTPYESDDDDDDEKKEKKKETLQQFKKDYSTNVEKRKWVRSPGPTASTLAVRPAHAVWLLHAGTLYSRRSACRLRSSPRSATRRSARWRSCWRGALPRR